MKSCENCKHWIDATAECAIFLEAEATDMEIFSSIQKALELDKNEENDCESFE